MLQVIGFLDDLRSADSEAFPFDQDICVARYGTACMSSDRIQMRLDSLTHPYQLHVAAHPIEESSHHHHHSGRKQREHMLIAIALSA